VSKSLKVTQNLVLTKVNCARVALGGTPIRSLRKGRVGESDDCPIANSLSDVCGPIEVTLEGICFDNDVFTEIIAREWGVSLESKLSLETPAEMVSFILLFDEENYPELVV